MNKEELEDLHKRVEAIRVLIERDPEIYERKRKLIRELSELSYEQLNHILRGSEGKANE